MADSSENESEEEPTQKPIKTLEERLESTDNDLQIIFKKLRVDNDSKRFKSKSRIMSTRRRGSHINRKELKSKKKVLKDATFIYKTCHAPKSKIKAQDCNVDSWDLQANSNQLEIPTAETERTVNHKLVNQSGKNSTDISKSCSNQFRQAQISKIPHGEVNFDDTTPEELAAYFDQLLHIPKPMSAMAEMMYT